MSLSEDDPAIPVNILRDTAASVSMMLESSVSNLEDAYTGERVVQGVGETVTVPLCKLYLRTDLLSQPVTVGVGESLPV